MPPPDSGGGDDLVTLDWRVDPAMAVVRTVAEMTGQSPTEMERLVSVVDPDALNRMFDGTDDGSSSVSVTFEYCGKQVTVTAESIRVAPPESGEE